MARTRWCGSPAVHEPALFRTGWFVESLATQTLVVFVIRTAGNPFRSSPSPALLISVFAVVTSAGALPYSSVGNLLQLTPPPASMLGAVAALAATSLLVVQVVKTWFRRHALL